ncbi:MAG: hypothetical protein SFU85_10660 [Candidatus Methylacidiphilales bacterium]|nr:hypothetical protein [Candidatus Methylacidiphilales bacterium]
MQRFLAGGWPSWLIRLGLTKPRVLIFGQGKSGSSALFHALREQTPFPPGTTFFEPSLEIQAAFPKQGRLLAKILIKNIDSQQAWGGLATFNRRILLVRDPRDQLVSRMLYKIWDVPAFRDDVAMGRWLDLLRRKETSPGSISLLELLREYGSWFGDDWEYLLRDNRRDYDRRCAIVEAVGGFFVFRYEDFVDGRTEGLSAFLGIPIHNRVEVPQELARVRRTKQRGDWRHWFIPGDVDKLRPWLQKPLAEHYPGSDWELSPAPHINPGHASGYVRRIVNERRALDGLPPLPVSSSS